MQRARLLGLEGDHDLHRLPGREAQAVAGGLESLRDADRVDRDLGVTGVRRDRDLLDLFADADDAEVDRLGAQQQAVAEGTP